MKFYGKVGFWKEDVEVSPGVYKPQVVERDYYGEILKDNRRFQSSDSQNGTFTVTNRISILSDLYFQQNWSSVRYVIWNDMKIEAKSVDVDYPRITLELGGEYHGENTPTTE